MSDTSDVTMHEDGVITYSDESRCVFEMLANRAPSRCGRKVQADEVALAFLACPDGKETTEELWDYVTWAVKRTRWTPRLLCPDEVREIRDTGRCPEVHPEVAVREGNEVTFCPQGMFPVLMSVAADLQKTLEMPVEWQHVLYALIQVTNHAFSKKCGQSEALVSVDVLANVLVEYVQEHGHLPPIDSVSGVTDATEPLNSEDNSADVSGTEHRDD